MNPIQRRLTRRCSFIVCQALTVVCMIVMIGPLWSQVITATSTSQSDPNAVALVNKAITALGGAANWQSIGAATAQVVETKPDGSTITVQWSDDWHLRHAQFRRDATSPSGQPITMMADQSSRTRAVAGEIRKLPREEDIAVLAAAYPAAALILSLNRSDCLLSIVAVRSGPTPNSPPDSSGPAVAEDCRPADFPMAIRILWQFSPSTGLPIRVRLPIRDYLRNAILYQTARFDAFTQQGGLTLPSTVSFIRAGRPSYTLTISRWSFGPSLPASTFTATSEQQP